MGLSDIPLCVVGHRGLPEADCCHVGLLRSHHVSEEARCPVNSEHEEPSRHRIEGSGMAHAAGAGGAARAGDDIVGRQPTGLVNEEEAVHYSSSPASSSSR